jgi:hypothetical protein
VPPAALLCVIVILAGAAMIAGPGLHNGTIDPRGLVWAVPGPIIYAFYLAANARLMRHHPPLIGAGVPLWRPRGSLSRRGAVARASLPKTTPGWLSFAFLALGPGAVAAVSLSYSGRNSLPPNAKRERIALSASDPGNVGLEGRISDDCSRFWTVRLDRPGQRTLAPALRESTATA